MSTSDDAAARRFWGFEPASDPDRTSTTSGAEKSAEEAARAFWGIPEPEAEEDQADDDDEPHDQADPDEVLRRKLDRAEEIGYFARPEPPPPVGMVLPHGERRVTFPHEDRAARARYRAEAEAANLDRRDPESREWRRLPIV